MVNLHHCLALQLAIGPLIFSAGLLTGLLLSYLLLNLGMRLERTRNQTHKLKQAPLTTRGHEAEEIPEHILTVITAAVAASFDSPVSVRSVTRTEAHPTPPYNLWSIEGRRQIYRSHQFR